MDQWGNKNKITYALERREGLKTAWEHILNLSENIIMANSSLYSRILLFEYPHPHAHKHIHENEWMNPTQK